MTAVEKPEEITFTKVSKGYNPQKDDCLSTAKSGNKYLVVGNFTKEELDDLTERTDKFRDRNQTWLRYK